MVCARSVIERILNELEPRDAHSIKSLMVGATGVARTQRGYAQIFQRLNPLGKDRSYSGILLKVNAANLAAAVIDIEIPGNFCWPGLSRNGPTALRSYSVSLSWSGSVERGT